MGLSVMVSPNRVQAATPPPHFPAALQTTTSSSSSSIYNLAFNEVQTQLGQLAKPINRMNLDEILKTVINTGGTTVTREEGERERERERRGVVDTTINNNNNNNNDFDLNSDHNLVKNALSPSLSSSSSSSSPVPFNFTQAIKNEVWREVVQQQQDQSSNNVACVGNGTGSNSNNNEKFVQTTLEDFIIRHGGFDVGNPQPVEPMDSLVPVSQSTQWLQYPMVQQQQPVTTPLLGNSVLDVGYSDHQLVSSMPMVVATSSGVQPASERKRRYSDDMIEKTIERRQKRMIKNRESAARSRQRKQDHIKHLENRITQLRRNNQNLMKETELLPLFSTNRENSKHQLSRTTSAKF